MAAYNSQRSGGEAKSMPNFPGACERKKRKITNDETSGKRDMGIDGVWTRRGVAAKSEAEYHL